MCRFLTDPPDSGVTVVVIQAAEVGHCTEFTTVLPSKRSVRLTPGPLNPAAEHRRDGRNVGKSVHSQHIPTLSYLQGRTLPNPPYPIPLTYPLPTRPIQRIGLDISPLSVYWCSIHPDPLPFFLPVSHTNPCCHYVARKKFLPKMKKKVN